MLETFSLLRILCTCLSSQAKSSQIWSLYNTRLTKGQFEMLNTAKHNDLKWFIKTCKIGDSEQVNFGTSNAKQTINLEALAHYCHSHASATELRHIGDANEK